MTSRSAMGVRSIRVFRGGVPPRFTFTTNFVFFMERPQDIEDEDAMTFFGGQKAMPTRVRNPVRFAVCSPSLSGLVISFSFEQSLPGWEGRPVTEKACQKLSPPHPDCDNMSGSTSLSAFLPPFPVAQR